MFQFPHIPWVVIEQESLKRLIAECHGISPGRWLVALQKVFGQFGDVAPSRPEGRHLDLHDVETIKQVLSKSAVGNEPAKIPIRCRAQP